MNSPEDVLKRLQDRLAKMGVEGFNQGAKLTSPYPLGKIYVREQNHAGKLLYHPDCQTSTLLRKIIWLHAFRQTFSADTLPLLSEMGFEVIRGEPWVPKTPIRKKKKAKKKKLIPTM